MCSCPRAARAWSHERRCHHSATNIIIFGDTGKCVHFRLRASVSKWSWCNDQQNGHNCFSQQQRTSPELQQKSFSVILILRLQNTSSGFCSGSFTIHLFLYIFSKFVHMRLVLQIQVEWMHFVQTLIPSGNVWMRIVGCKTVSNCSIDRGIMRPASVTIWCSAARCGGDCQGYQQQHNNTASDVAPVITELHSCLLPRCMEEQEKWLSHWIQKILSKSSGHDWSQNWSF